MAEPFRHASRRSQCRSACSPGEGAELRQGAPVLRGVWASTRPEAGVNIWLMMGQRFEATQVENLGRGECVELLMRISSDRGSADRVGNSEDRACCACSGPELALGRSLRHRSNSVRLQRHFPRLPDVLASKGLMNG